MPLMAELLVAHTGDLTPPALAAARDLLEGVFPGTLTDDDWDHAQGGMHALLWEGADLVGHASLVQRRMLHGGRALRTGYVEGVGVRADRRRRGHGGTLMSALERLARGAYELGALSTTADGAPLYAAHGWEPWSGPTFAMTPTGRARTAGDDGGIYVLPLLVPLDLDGELTCDWRDGDLW